MVRRSARAGGCQMFTTSPLVCAAAVLPSAPRSTVQARAYMMVAPLWAARVVPSTARFTVSVLPLMSCTSTRSLSMSRVSPRKNALPVVTARLCALTDEVRVPVWVEVTQSRSVAIVRSVHTRTRDPTPTGALIVTDVVLVLGELPSVQVLRVRSMSVCPHSPVTDSDCCPIPSPMVSTASVLRSMSMAWYGGPLSGGHSSTLLVTVTP